MDAARIPQRRGLYRVRFPIPEQPIWCVNQTDVPVIEMSENSCRVVALSEAEIDPDSVWCGHLRFADGERVWIEGSIVRRDQESIVLRLSKGVSYRKLMSLQRDFLRRYPVRHDVTW